MLLRTQAFRDALSSLGGGVFDLATRLTVLTDQHVQPLVTNLDRTVRDKTDRVGGGHVWLASKQTDGLEG